MQNPTFSFPPIEFARDDGLLCISQTINPAQIWLAHQKGIFPWYDDTSPIMWWSPDPRSVIYCDNIHQSKSLKKTMHKTSYQIHYDRAFANVVEYCAQVHGATWITEDIKKHYLKLHQQGLAHSCELWQGDKLCGGLYGVALNQVFCGESMFSLIPSASKIILIHLCQSLAKNGIILLDTQFITPHLKSMGAIEIPRENYRKYLNGDPHRLQGSWQNSSHWQ